MTAEQQEKARFFAQYWGQSIMQSRIKGIEDKYTALHNVDIVPETIIGKWFLLLTPLSMITDEDMQEIDKILFTVNTKDKNFNNLVFEVFNTDSISEQIKIIGSCAVFGFLRSRGYALPYMRISVKEQIEKGWIKLRESV